MCGVRRRHHRADARYGRREGLNWVLNSALHDARAEPPNVASHLSRRVRREVTAHVAGDGGYALRERAGVAHRRLQRVQLALPEPALGADHHERINRGRVVTVIAAVDRAAFSHVPHGQLFLQLLG